jgi:Fic family protein
MNYDAIDAKKRELDRLRPLPPEVVRSLDAWFRVELTYTSNALEGNTLSRRETAVVLEKGLTVGGKSLVEHLEATNHGRAIDFVSALVTHRKKPVSEDHVLRLHEVVLKGIHDGHAGRYRDVAVRIAGSTVVLPNPRKVPDLMEALGRWLHEKSSLHPVAFAAEAHFKLVSIHPFIDGNGRTARLLMNLFLMRRGLPPAIIRPRDRVAYLGALEMAQLGGSRSAYDTLIARAVERSLDIYLEAAGKTPSRATQAAHRRSKSGAAPPVTENLMRIGQLAKAVGEPLSTIRHWTHLGLLHVAQTTPAGYQLFAADAIARCHRIQTLKGRRLTLPEIRTQLDDDGP